MKKRIKSKNDLLSLYTSNSEELKQYFEHVPKLVEGFPLDVCLAYAFSRLELGQNMALYCGVVKMHRANSDIARNAVDSHHMTREGFVQLYKTVFAFDLPEAAAKALKTAEDTRDAVMHGKSATEDRLRNSVARVIEYADAINTQLNDECGFRPFGYLRGFSGRAKKLDKRTTRFVLKGMGFAIR